MNMILEHMALQNLNLQASTNLSNDITQARANGSGQNRLAIFRDPYKMVFDFVLCMWARSIILHPPRLIQLLAESYPPERRGFKPLKADELTLDLRWWGKVYAKKYAHFRKIAI